LFGFRTARIHWSTFSVFASPKDANRLVVQIFFLHDFVLNATDLLIFTPIPLQAWSKSHASAVGSMSSGAPFTDPRALVVIWRNPLSSTWVVLFVFSLIKSTVDLGSPRAPLVFQSADFAVVFRLASPQFPFSSDPSPPAVQRRGRPCRPPWPFSPFSLFLPVSENKFRKGGFLIFSTAPLPFLPPLDLLIHVCRLRWPLPCLSRAQNFPASSSCSVEIFFRGQRPPVSGPAALSLAPLFPRSETVDAANVLVFRSEVASRPPFCYATSRLRPSSGQAMLLTSRSNFSFP